MAAKTRGVRMKLNMSNSGRFLSASTRCPVVSRRKGGGDRLLALCAVVKSWWGCGTVLPRRVKKERAILASAARALVST